MRIAGVLLTFVLLVASTDFACATPGGTQQIHVRPWRAILFGVFLTASLFYDVPIAARINTITNSMHESLWFNKTTDTHTLPPKTNQTRPLRLYYSSFGGESNCEFCLQKARWIASFVGASALYVPTCYKTHHTSEDVKLFDLYDEYKDGHCCDDDAVLNGEPSKKSETSKSFPSTRTLI